MKLKYFSLIMAIALVSAACQPIKVQSADGTTKLSGDFTYTNDFVLETYYVEHAVALVDLHGFVIRDRDWVIPVQGQVLGFMKLDQPNKKGTFNINLPEIPEGTINDLSHGTAKQQGVQVFCVGYWGNLVGGPYAEGDDETHGWPTYLTSVIIDVENKSEVIGGKLVVWAHDANQKFPTGFGSDNLLFTSDDPLGSLPAGYSVIDLDQKPFKIMRSSEEKLVLNEPKDIAIKDFSSETYSAAFEKMFNQVRKEYAFNGIIGKQPDWDKVYADVLPLVKKSEQDHDAMAYYQALKSFILTFKDGHVSIDGGDLSTKEYQDNVMGGFGLAIRELDDGKIIASFVMKDGPADQAGIRVGAEVIKFNGLPINQAVNQVIPINGPSSTDFGYRYDQVRFLLRKPVGFEATITFENEGAEEQTVSLTTIQERDSLIASSLFSGYDPNALPVEYKILDQGVGYVRINSNYDDLNLVIRLFMRALKTFKDNELPAVIIDMRKNTGGSPLGLAGFLDNKVIPLGQLEYFSDKTNQFEPDGPREKVLPNQEQYHFSKEALLVGQACYSACEIDAYGFSQVPGMIVVGETPSGGTEAEVSRGSYKLPEGISIDIPTGRFTLPDGSIFLEGKGVQPTLRIPVTRETILGTGDAVLDAAIKAVME